MPNNSTSVYEGLVFTSISALESTFSANIGFIIIGLLTTLTSLLELATIAKDKKLRTRCYFLIANISVASALYALSYVGTGIKRLFRLYYLFPEVNTKRICAGEMFTNYLGQSATVFLPLATAVDRVTATMNPIKYKQMSSTFSVATAILAWSLALADSCFTFYGDDQQNLVANCNLVSSSDLLYQVQTSVEMAISALVTLLYLLVVLALRRQLSTAKIKSEKLAASKMKIQIKVAKTLGVDSIVHLLTQVATRIGLTLLTPLPPAVRFATAPFIRLILIAGCGMSFIIFLIINKEFHDAFRRTFHCSPLPSSQVAPSSIGPSFRINDNRNTRLSNVNRSELIDVTP